MLGNHIGAAPKPDIYLWFATKVVWRLNEIVSANITACDLLLLN